MHMDHHFGLLYSFNDSLLLLQHQYKFERIKITTKMCARNRGRARTGNEEGGCEEREEELKKGGGRS